MKPWLGLILGLGCLLGAHPANCGEERAPERLLVWATATRFPMMVGRWEARRGWQSTDHFYSPPEKGAIFSLLRLENPPALAETREGPPRNRLATPVEWTVRISSWFDGRGEPYALGVRPPLKTWKTPRVLPLEDPDWTAEVSRYLRRQGVSVEHPFLTQLVQVDMDGDGSVETLLTAHSDASAFTDQAPAAVYALALVHTVVRGKGRFLPVRQQVSFKPADRTVEEHERLYGRRDFFRFLTCADLDEDGLDELVLYTAQKDATQIDVMTLRRHRLIPRLSAFKFLYQ